MIVLADKTIVTPTTNGINCFLYSALSSMLPYCIFNPKYAIKIIRVIAAVATTYPKILFVMPFILLLGEVE